MSNCVCMIGLVCSIVQRTGDVVGHGSTFRLDAYRWNIRGMQHSEHCLERTAGSIGCGHISGPSTGGQLAASGCCTPYLHLM